LKQFLFFTLLAISTTSVLGQSNVAPGTYTNFSDITQTGYIINEDWKNSPTKIRFSTTRDGNFQTIEAKNIKAFSIESTAQYESHRVKIDRTTYATTTLNRFREPDLKEERLLLKVLVSGGLNLYQFREGAGTTYFYKGDDELITTLIYKRYYKGTDIAKNEMYKQQLYNAVDCEVVKGKATNLSYKEKSLTTFFSQANECLDINPTVYQKNDNEKNFRIKVNVGVRSGSIEVEALNDSQDGKLDNAIGLTYGVELEHFFGFNNKKWSAFFEIQRLSYDSETSVSTVLSGTSTDITRSVDITGSYRAIDFTMGARRYFPVSEHMKINLTAGLSYDIISKTVLDFETNVNELPSFEATRPSFTGTFGLGLSYKKLGVALRYVLPRNNIGQEFFNQNAYNNSFILSLNYAVFKF